METWDPSQENLGSFHKKSDSVSIVRIMWLMFML